LLGVGGYLLFTKDKIGDTTLNKDEVLVIVDQLLEKNTDEFYLLPKSDRDLVVQTINKESDILTPNYYCY